LQLDRFRPGAERSRVILLTNNLGVEPRHVRGYRKRGNKRCITFTKMFRVNAGHDLMKDDLGLFSSMSFALSENRDPCLLRSRGEVRFGVLSVLLYVSRGSPFSVGVGHGPEREFANEPRSTAWQFRLLA
jgi:hypothetical protein